MLVLCFSTAFAEEITAQSETYDQSDLTGQEQSNSGDSGETLFLPPIIPDVSQDEPESAGAVNGDPISAGAEAAFPAVGENVLTDAIPLLPEEDLSPTVENPAEPAAEEPSSTEENPTQPTAEEPSPTEENPEQPASEEPSPTEENPEQPAEEEPSPAEPENEEPAPEPTKPDSSAAEPPATIHEATHHVEERVHEGIIYQKTDNMQMHNAFIVYDLYCIECQRVIAGKYRVDKNSEPHTWTYTCEEPTCSREGVVHFICTLCGMAYDETLPCLEHVWGEWEDQTDYSLPDCLREQIMVHRCVNCGLEETVKTPAMDHQWEAVSYTEATCTSEGAAVRRCRICGKEETIVLSAYGHSFVELNGQDSQDKSVCAICGEVREEPKEQSSKTHMYYNNTVTSFGPTTRELIGGSVWNRVTPVDLSKEGVFTYPLIASNQYTVGTATLINSQEGQQVNYRLSSSNINVHSESLVVYPSLEALRTGEHARSFEFNEPIDLRACFGEDAHVIIAITLKADYDANSAGVRRFSPDQNWIDQMMEMIK